MVIIYVVGRVSTGRILLMVRSAKALSPMGLPVEESVTSARKKEKRPCPHGHAVMWRQRGSGSEVLSNAPCLIMLGGVVM